MIADKPDHADAIRKALDKAPSLSDERRGRIIALLSLRHQGTKMGDIGKPRRRVIRVPATPIRKPAQEPSRPAPQPAPEPVREPARTGS
jgi:hypothetical protein